LTYRAAGKVLGVRARDGRGGIPGEDRGGALRDGAEEGDDGVGPPVSGRGVARGGAVCCWRVGLRPSVCGRRACGVGNGPMCWERERAGALGRLS
jgi:hypothetical protein